MNPKDNNKSLKSNNSGKKYLLPDHVIDQVKQLDIVDALTPYITIHKNGSGYEAICPFHQDHKPSLKINAAKHLYKCFVCGKYGKNAIDVVMKIKSVEWYDAVRLIAADHQISIPEMELTHEEEEAHQKREAIYNVNRWAAEWFSKQLRDPENHKTLDYVKSRWNDDSIDHFNLGYAPNGSKKLLGAAKKEGYREDLLREAGLIGEDKEVDFFQGRVIFPIFDRRGIAGFTGRVLPGGSLKPKYLNTRGTLVYHKSEILYNFYEAGRHIKEKQNAYLVEGNADVIRLHQIGIYNSFAISGTSLTAGHIEALKRITPCITLIGDVDPAGQSSVVRSAKMILESGMYCKIISIPDGGEQHDPDSFFTDKAQFDKYDVPPNKKDYILYLAEKEKDNHLEPDQKASLIIKMAELIYRLPQLSHQGYIDDVCKVLDTKKLDLKNSINALLKVPAAKSKTSTLEPEGLDKTQDNAVRDEIDEERLKDLHNFYFIEKDRDLQYKGIKIDRVNFIEKLKSMGYLRFDTDIDSCSFVQASNNTLREVSTTVITDHFIEYIETIEGYQHQWEGGSKFVDSFILKRKIYDGIDTYFSSSLLKRLKPEQPIRIKRDTRDEKFLFYQNGFVSVTEACYSFHDYTDLDQYIWANQMLNRNFNNSETYLDKPSVFQQFIWNICNRNEERLLAMQTIIGYTLHNYMDCKLWAIILTDSRISQDGEANGRTGKTLWGKALGHMLNTDEKGSVYKELNGKDFTPKNKFKFEEANLDTQLIHINDIYNDYNIENSFNDISEGIKVDKKNEKPIRIRPKFIFSTNKTIIIEGESAKDRVIQFEFADYYNSEFSPIQEFGTITDQGKLIPHYFFTDWDGEEWSRFDYFMITCINKYFKHGLIRPAEINLSRRNLIDHTSDEFLKFMEDAMSETGISFDQEENGLISKVEFKIGNGIPFSKKTAYNAFVRLNSDFNNQRFKQRSFTKWLRMFAKKNKLNFFETRSNGVDFFDVTW